MIENRRATSPFLIPDFTIEYIFLHNAIQIFFQDDSRGDRKKKDVSDCVCLGNSASHCWLPGLCFLNGSESLPVPRCCRQEPRQLVKQHSNRVNKPNSSMRVARPRRDRASEMQSVYTGRGGHPFALLLLMSSRICTAPWQLCPASAGQGFRVIRKEHFWVCSSILAYGQNFHKCARAAQASP